MKYRFQEATLAAICCLLDHQKDAMLFFDFYSSC